MYRVWNLYSEYSRVGFGQPLAPTTWQRWWRGYKQHRHHTNTHQQTQGIQHTLVTHSTHRITVSFTLWDVKQSVLGSNLQVVWQSVRKLNCPSADCTNSHYTAPSTSSMQHGITQFSLNFKLTFILYFISPSSDWNWGNCSRVTFTK